LPLISRVKFSLTNHPQSAALIAFFLLLLNAQKLYAIAWPIARNGYYTGFPAKRRRAPYTIYDITATSPPKRLRKSIQAGATRSKFLAYALSRQISELNVFAPESALITGGLLLLGKIRKAADVNNTPAPYRSNIQPPKPA
jgi:hypothetical protein